MKERFIPELGRHALRTTARRRRGTHRDQGVRGT
jgi:hypothetical protein